MCLEIVRIMITSFPTAATWLSSRSAVEFISGWDSAFYIGWHNSYQCLYWQYHWTNLDANTRLLTSTFVLQSGCLFNDAVYFI